MSTTGGNEEPDTGDVRPRFERGTGFLLSRLGSMASHSWSEFLEGHDLTLSQYVVVTVLREQGPLGQQQLARIVAMDPRNIVAVLDSLEGRRLIERIAVPDDRRRRTVSLTPLGNDLVDGLSVDAAAGGNEFLDCLDGTERRLLNDILNQLFDAHTRKLHQRQTEATPR
jgi:DNA-binding MarR family transcriptional regulator